MKEAQALKVLNAWVMWHTLKLITPAVLDGKTRRRMDVINAREEHQRDAQEVSDVESSWAVACRCEYFMHGDKYPLKHWHNGHCTKEPVPGGYSRCPNTCSLVWHGRCEYGLHDAPPRHKRMPVEDILLEWLRGRK